MDGVLASIKALSDKQRIRIVSALSGGELCLCDLQEILKLSPSTVSRHVSILKGTGLVTSRNEGKWRYFNLAKNLESTPKGGLVRWLLQSFENNAQAYEDKTLAGKLRERQEWRCSFCVAENYRSKKKRSGKERKSK